MPDLRNMSLSDLKNLAKERNLRGYSKLRKAELIRFLETTRPIPFPSSRRPSPRPIPAPRSTRSILDERIPEINVPVLKPDVVTSQKPEKVVEESITTVNDWLDWLTKPKIKIKKNPEVEKLKQKINKLFEERFEIHRGRSALKEFATVNTIDGREGYDPQSFLRAVRRTVIDFFKNNRR